MASSQPQPLTRRQKRRRIILLVLLLLLLLLLAYSTYYFVNNRKLPSLDIGPAEASIAPPEYLYSITGSGKSELKRPAGVEIGPNGRVYVVDAGNRRVSVFTRAGTFLFSFDETEEGKFRAPVNVAINENEVWVTDRRIQAISIYDLRGEFLRTFQPQDEPEFAWGPLAITFDESAALRATDVGQTEQHRIVFFTEEGSRTVTVGRTAQVSTTLDSPSEFFFPSGIATGPKGVVYVADSNNRRIQVFGSSGEFVRIIDSSGIPRGLAVDDNQLFAVDALAHVVDIYDLQGKRLAQFGSNGFGPGQFSYPADVDLDARGRIFVTDRENNQVQVWGWPVAAPPAIVTPSSPAGWALCLLPLLLLLVPFALRKIRVVVTPDFVEALIDDGAIVQIAAHRRLRLMCTLADHPLYEGRMIGDIDLGELIEAEQHSESDVRAMRDRLEISEQEAIVLTLADRSRGLGTQDPDLRRLARLAEIATFDAAEFQERYLSDKKKPE